ncbi:restriction endonuclease subunit S [Lactococcus lactis]|uniref:Restriction endonuclease subunit S n=2 Tax=Lactococcus lactis TaxID=1358 RepID=A0A8B3F315_LACLL|nr:restriction endonuclease subunit S [Lactococcus lactis subsp. lactis bv. diacetylactis]
MMSKKSPQLRFEGFTDDWEQRKLGDEFKKVNERNNGSFGREHWISVANMYFQDPEKVQSNNINTRTYVMRIGDMAFEGNKSSKFKYGRFVVNDIGNGVVSELFPIYRHNNEYDNSYWKNAIQIERIMAPIFAKAITSSGVSSNKLDNNHFLNQKICIPPLKEQKKIGSFFKQLDDTIALHQRKLDLLKEQKKGYLQKMFPKNGAKVPELRFAGFADDWEERKLAELATMNARIGWQNLRTSEFLDEGDYILITGTDFKDGEIDYSNIHYVEKERFDQDKKIQVQDGSILITKDGTLGKVAYVKNLPGPATLNAGVFNVRVINSDETDSKYLFHYLKAPFLLKFADEQSTGGTIKHLNQNVLVKFPVPLPGLDEQKRIANLLESMDNLIAANQRKLDLLKEQKKGFLQKMFV